MCGNKKNFFKKVLTNNLDLWYNKRLGILAGRRPTAWPELPPANLYAKFSWLFELFLAALNFPENGRTNPYRAGPDHMHFFYRCLIPRSDSSISQIDFSKKLCYNIKKRHFYVSHILN